MLSAITELNSDNSLFWVLRIQFKSSIDISTESLYKILLGLKPRKLATCVRDVRISKSQGTIIHQHCIYYDIKKKKHEKRQRKSAVSVS